jgi:hypothetical protein
MRIRSVFLLVVVIMTLLGGVVASPAHAVVVTTYEGTIDDTDPTLLVAIISTPNCTGTYGSVDVHYDVIEFIDPVPGEYVFEMLVDDVGGGNASAMYLLEGSFDPAAVADTCVAATNSNPLNLTYEFEPDTDYYAIVFDDTFAQTGGTYELQVTSPDPPPPPPSSSTTTTSSTSTSTTSTSTSSTTTTQAVAAATAVRPRFTG